MAKFHRLRGPVLLRLPSICNFRRWFHGVVAHFLATQMNKKAEALRGVLPEPALKLISAYINDEVANIEAQLQGVRQRGIRSNADMRLMTRVACGEIIPIIKNN